METGPRRRSSERLAVDWPRAAVFDCDGLLVDTAACWAAAYRRVARMHGAEVEKLELDALAGASVGLATAALGEMLDVVVDPEALRHALLESFAATPLSALPGVVPLLAGLGA